MLIERPDLERIWASGAPVANVEDPDVTTPGKFDAGWVAEVPTYQNFNYLQRHFTRGLAYLAQKGVAEYNPDEDYYIGSIVNISGDLYVSMEDDNSGNNPLSGYPWRRVGPFATPQLFGAVGDGVTDDSAAIQAAINAHDNVLIPKGVYKVVSAPEVPSNKRIYGESGSVILQEDFDNAATISTGTEYAGLKILKNADNVRIKGLDIRGPFYGGSTSPVYRSIGIAVEGRYDEYFYDNGNYPASPDVTPTSLNTNIEILNCRISGFGQSGIIADNITEFRAKGNHITNCTRDGIRMYGCIDFDVSENFVEDMTDGFPGEGIAPNNNVYGITATRIYHSTAGDGSVDDYRPTRRGIIARNIVNNCANWKALDTHGGTDISFVDNVIFNAHIGVGIDKGGYTAADGYAPPRRLLIKGNVILAGPSNTELHRAGIAVFAHDATLENIGEDITVEGNYIEGFGLDSKDGGIVPSFIDRLNILGNTITDSLGRCVHFQSSVFNANVKDNIFANTRETTKGVCYGVNLAAATQYANIDDNIFRQSSSIGATMVAIANVAPDPGFGCKLGTSNSFIGDVDESLSPANLVNDSGFLLQTIAYANVNNNGTATLSSGVAIVSVNRTAQGVVEVELDTNASILVPAVTFKGSGTIGYATSSGTTVTVQTRDLSNALIDTGFYLVVNGY